MPDEMSLIVVVTWEGKEKRWSIETVFLAKLCKLFGCRLLTEHSNCRIAWYKFDQ